MMQDVTIRIVRDRRDWEALATRWATVWDGDAQAKPFQHPAWLIPWWHHFGQKDLLVCTFWSGEKLVGLLPTYVYRPGEAQERQLLLVGAGTSDYLGGVFLSGCRVEHVVAALELLGLETSWDVAYFTQLLKGSLLEEALREMKSDAVQCFAGESCSETPAMRIAQLPKKVRADVLYYRNAAIGRGKLQLRVALEDELLPTFELLVRLHSARWQAAGEPGVLADPLVLAWHREAVPLLARNGLVRLYRLELEGDPIAVLYALADGAARDPRTESFYLIGSALEWAELHPGTLLTAMVVQQAAEQGVKTIDMLRGKEAYKKFWHVEEVRTFGFAWRRQLL